ncbi:hypothetical protein KTH_14000 [Thermosporothrix hazakensis]|nr:hypothetical protein KTH_14000 [Thermosporothrix hazakensis]
MDRWPEVKTTRKRDRQSRGRNAVGLTGNLALLSLSVALFADQWRIDQMFGDEPDVHFMCSQHLRH